MCGKYTSSTGAPTDERGPRSTMSRGHSAGIRWRSSKLLENLSRIENSETAMHSTGTCPLGLMRNHLGVLGAVAG